MKVSVIIPVFNAVEYVEKAVESALKQVEVAEVILIEDGSADSSLVICRNLTSKYKKVKLLTHPNNSNRGPSESRNLGIKYSNFEFISFLDADDLYADNRFECDKINFLNPEVYISYNSSAIFYPDGRIVDFGFKEDVLNNIDPISIHSFSKFIHDNDISICDTNSLTIRKSVFDTEKLFDIRLDMHEDTELWYRISRKFLFYSGCLNRPVSYARRHRNNRITEESISSRLRFLLVWIDNIGLKDLEDFEKKAVSYHLARALSNPIKNHFLRKSILHGFQLFTSLTRPVFIPLFYHWGMRKFNLYKS
ncbi:glycosyltransferase family 2 protein [Algoriphagus sp. CAU 1675]|uniref:glycosyltransferase family 2 protein n=1 Tax=Algoriphagus sp. CAU 1675 TaxID=3032597 RepID=UPI0023DC9D58|nr:glycosyltransferase family 2 protein [Algoriphagus sp. CAU 1675]MDF2159402.1 glycosyltransferase family 2 protein [Algoriphagus sp. CAU 1675]